MPQIDKRGQSILSDMLGTREYDGVEYTPMQLFLRHLNENVAVAQEKLGGLLGIDEVMKYAARRPAELGIKDDARGAGDAMRHLLLAGELHRTSPYLADAVLYGHEGINLFQDVPMEDITQDLYNNKIGKEIGRIATSRSNLEELSINELRNAKILPVEKFGR